MTEEDAAVIQSAHRFVTLRAVTQEVYFSHLRSSKLETPPEGATGTPYETFMLLRAAQAVGLKAMYMRETSFGGGSRYDEEHRELMKACREWDTSEHRGKVQDLVGRLCAASQAERRERLERSTAIAMSLHPRLGAMPMAALDSDLVRKIDHLTKGCGGAEDVGAKRRRRLSE